MKIIFQDGDRVMFSPEGLYYLGAEGGGRGATGVRIPNKDKRGTVRMKARGKQVVPGCVRIVWDGLAVPQTYTTTFIQYIPHGVDGREPPQPPDDPEPPEAA